MLANGSCIDASKCNTATTCGSLVNNQGLHGSSSWTNKHFSLAEAWFPPGGPYSVLIRAENRMGCGTGGIMDCVSSSSLAYRLLQSGWRCAVLLK